MVLCEVDWEVDVEYVDEMCGGDVCIEDWFGDVELVDGVIGEIKFFCWIFLMCCL